MRGQSREAPLIAGASPRPAKVLVRPAWGLGPWSFDRYIAATPTALDSWAGTRDQAHGPSEKSSQGYRRIQSFVNQRPRPDVIVTYRARSESRILRRFQGQARVPETEPLWRSTLFTKFHPADAVIAVMHRAGIRINPFLDLYLRLLLESVHRGQNFSPPH